MSSERVAVIDFGSQLTQLIARRVRHCNVYCEVFPWTVEKVEIDIFGPMGLILSGSSESTLEENSPTLPQFLLELKVPLLAICYGMQLLTKYYGGKVERGQKSEYGYAKLHLNEGGLCSPLLDGIENNSTVWMSHGDHVVQTPSNFDCIAQTERCTIAMIADEKNRIYGCQFHPETAESEQGIHIIDNFLKRVCGCAGTWKCEAAADELIREAQREWSKHMGTVILGLSGGVDSSVVAAILHKAIGPHLKCIIVDHGLLRKDEANNVSAAFRAAQAEICVEVVDARTLFFEKLRGVTDPETKRRIIGEQFIRVFEEKAKLYDDVHFLAQGTIYPDVIESACNGNAQLIKSHHNVGGLPTNMQLSLIEPLRKLFKDEVRNIGAYLKLPHEFLWRHPYPGPGFGVRILGEVSVERSEKLRAADAIFIDELHKANLYYDVSQAVVALIPIKAVGVKGDARVYEDMIVIRVVNTTDFMTASAVDLPPTLMRTAARRICNEVSGIGRVMYDYTDKPPATIEYE